MNDDLPVLEDMVVMEEFDCAKCGIRYGMPATLAKKRRADYAAFYCPNGHGQSFTVPPKTRDEQLDQARKDLQQSRGDLAAALDDLATARARISQLESQQSRAGRKGWLSR